MIGEKVSHYRILDELGQGGMGVLYRAEDTRLGRIVALKFLSPDLTRNERARERLVNEARAASVLDHPNICTIHEIEETVDGRVFLVLACYEGETARDRLERGCMPLDEAVGLGLHVARGLANAHGHDIVHRDIKPANVFITTEGIAKILDFGLARHAGQTRMTRVGSAVGTVAYMSPEQAQGEEVDEKSDVWSLGAFMYECLTGEAPFKGGHPQTVLHSIINRKPEPVGRLREDVPPELASIVMRCLEKRPSRRPTAGELVTRLGSLPHGRSPDPRAIRARTTTLVTAAHRTRRRTGLLATAVLASLVGLIATPVGRGAMRTLFRQDSLPTRRFVAVLPFTADGEEDIFARGFGQYLTLRLSQMEKLDADFRVVPAFEISRSDIDTPERALAISGATLAAVGNVSRTGDVVSMRVDVVETQSGRTLRTWKRDESAANVRALQRDAAVSLSDLLGVGTREGAAEEVEVGATTLPRAFEAYVNGLGTLAGDGADTAGAWEDSGDRIREAVALFELAVEADPAYALAHTALGEALLECQEAPDDEQCLSRAEEASELAVSLDDRMSSPHVTLARVHRLRENYDDARRELGRALEVDPLDLVARRELAEVGIESGESEFVEGVYLEAVDLREDYWRGYYDVGVFYHNTERDSQAIEFLTEASELVPNNPHPYSAMAVIYYHAEKIDKALTMLERSIDADPSWEGYNNLGTLYFTEGEYASAIRAYEKAVECDASQYEVWGNLASAYSVRDNGGETALEHYRRAATLCEPEYRKNPDDPHVLVHLASYYTEIGTPDDALGLVTRAIELAPNDAEVAFQAGHTYEVLGDRDMALSWIEKALECGYSRMQIENTPALRELCTDARYRSLVQHGGDNEGT